MTNTSLKLEINSLPKELRAEVADFVEFLKKKSRTKSKLKSREFGFAKGKIKLSVDFDEPLDEFKNYI
jgi:flagellar biosynthesis regulator FlaF